MLPTIEKTQSEALWLKRSAWGVLCLGLVASVFLWQHAAVQEKAEADHHFRHEVVQTTGQLQQAVLHYQSLLTSFQAMFLVSDQVDRATFHRHFNEVQSRQGYPALLAVQYHQRVRADEKAAFEQAVREDRSVHPDGYPHYRIHPPSNQAEFVPVKFNEPMEGNEAVMGYDTSVEPSRRDTLVRARDSGLTQFSPPLQLMQLKQQDNVGFVIRAPLYAKGHKTDTVAARRAAFMGQLSGVVHASVLMSSVIDRPPGSNLHWRLVDEGDAAPTSTPARQAALLFDSAAANTARYQPGDTVAPPDRMERTLQAGGRQWRLTFTRAPVNHFLLPYPLTALACGVLASLGLAWGLRGAAVRQQQAATMALVLSRKSRESEQRLRSVLNHTVDGIVTISPAGLVVSVNQAMCAIFGRPANEIVDRHLSLLVPAAAGSGTPGRTPPTIEEFLSLQSTGLDSMGRRTMGQRANGELFPLDLAVSTMDLDGQVQHIAILRDLTAQQQAETAILAAQRQLSEVDEMRRVIVHHAPYAIFLINRHGVIQTVNPAGETLLGYKPQHLIGKSTAQRFFEPAQVAERAQMLALRLNQPVQELDVLKHLADESPSLPTEWTLVRADGRSLVAEVSVTVLSDEMGEMTGYLAMAQDVTTRRDAEKQLQHMAMHDALTALPNRNMLQDHLKTCIARAEREGHQIALMFLDLDRFKKINDTLGHHIGDSVLIEVARRLRSAMRTSDIVARLGGDEFVVLLPRIAELSDGERVAQKVMDLFTEPLRIGPHELRVTPSIGLVLHPQHGDDAVTLMRHADLAMYQAKNRGRNRVQLYSDQLESPTADTLVLENDLYKALERNELRLHYQPQFDCATGQITGAEALVRWEHAGRLVPPGDFIPLAEESGLIVSMGEWVLREACVRAQAWRQQTHWPFRIAVNLSAVQLEHPGLIDTVTRALRDSGLPPTALELEITESVVVRESLRAADILTQLRDVGVSIAIDDFGVGYSSFAYLRELPVDRFKLDRSFLASVPQSAGDSRLAAALIAMAHRLEVGIVAEGVETLAQKDFLRDHGCDEAQGYLLGRPMNEEAFGALLARQSSSVVDVVPERERSDAPL